MKKQTVQNKLQESRDFRSLKEEAIKRYESEVFQESARTKFREDIEKYPLEDKRGQGFYCHRCDKVTKTPIVDATPNSVVYVWNGPNIWKIVICDKHNCGCKGL